MTDLEDDTLVMVLAGLARDGEDRGGVYPPIVGSILERPPTRAGADLLPLRVVVEAGTGHGVAFEVCMRGNGSGLPATDAAKRSLRGIAGLGALGSDGAVTDSSTSLTSTSATDAPPNRARIARLWRRRR